MAACDESMNMSMGPKAQRRTDPQAGNAEHRSRAHCGPQRARPSPTELQGWGDG